MPASIGSLYVGTSGFSYPSWRGGFYPAGAQPREFLRLYARRLPSVELNSTFYRLPSDERLGAWAAETPETFRFAVKMSRRITHHGHFELIETFCLRLRSLGEKLGVVLAQFPPSRRRDDTFLGAFLDALDPAFRYALEFRHPSWEVDDLLGARGIACVGALVGAPRFRYLRLREPPYDDKALAVWADRLRPLLAEGVDVYCYFKHEDEPDAPRYAERLLELVT